MTVQAYERPALALPALAALGASVAGGVVWALIVKYTQYEIGIVAWAIALVAAFVAVAVAKGYKSTTLAIVSVVAALIGIVVGKYLSYVLWGDENGYDFAGMWSWWDALWIGLAVVTAFRVARPGDDDTVESRAPPE